MDLAPALPVARTRTTKKLLPTDRLADRLTNNTTIARSGSAPNSSLSRCGALRDRSKTPPPMRIGRPVRSEPAIGVARPTPPTLGKLARVIAAQHPAAARTPDPAPRRQTPTLTYTPSREPSGEYAVPEDMVEIEAACEAVYAEPQKGSQKRRAAAYAMAKSQNLRVERERLGHTEVLQTSG